MTGLPVARVVAVLSAVLALGGAAPAYAAGTRTSRVHAAQRTEDPVRVTPIAAARDSFVTRSGSTLQLQGRPFRFVGANEYYLGLDDNLHDSAGRPVRPTHAAIDSALDAAVAIGATVVRAHTLGISVGTPQSIEPSRGVWNEAAFEPVDYAVAAARARGLRLMVPLTDQWRYYHGGKSTFTGWRGYPNAADLHATAASDPVQRASEAHFYTDPAVVADFRAYVTHVLRHVGLYTGRPLADDPTVAVWETGNELWDAPTAWTASTATFLKTLAPRQLVADGSAATGRHVADAAVDAPDVDIVGGHFYPRDTTWMQQDAAVAAGHGKAYVVGEFDPTGDPAAFLARVAATPGVSGALVWTLLPRLADGTPEPHGDGYALWVPATTAAMGRAESSLQSVAATMAAAWLAPASGRSLSPTAALPGWSTWASAGGTARVQDDALLLRTGVAGGWSDKASATLVAPARSDAGITATITADTVQESYLSLVLRGSGDATAVADAAAYRVEISSAGYASVQRRGPAAAVLSPGLAVPGFAPGVAFHVEFGVAGTTLTLRLWSAGGRPAMPSWTGADTGPAVTAAGSTAISLNGGGVAGTAAQWRIGGVTTTWP